MPALVVTALLLLLSIFANIAADNFLSARSYRLESSKTAQAVVAREVDFYRLETGTVPASLAVLAATPGYRHLVSYLAETNGGVFPSTSDFVFVTASNVLTDGVWTYQRAAVVAPKDRTETTSSYLSASRNTCPPTTGNAAFAQAASWCGSRDSFWDALDTRQVANKRLAVARKRQDLTVTKFVRQYQASASFPAAASATALRALVTPASGVSTPGTNLATCQGTFYLVNIPLECSDLYNSFGNPVSYQRTGAKQILLTSTSDIKDASGALVAVSLTRTMP